MTRLEAIEAKLVSVQSKLAVSVPGLRQDVTTLKALIEALRTTAADEATLLRLETVVASIETHSNNLTSLDQETPPPAPPA